MVVPRTKEARVPHTSPLLWTVTVSAAVSGAEKQHGRMSLLHRFELVTEEG